MTDNLIQMQGEGIICVKRENDTLLFFVKKNYYFDMGITKQNKTKHAQWINK